MRDGNVFGLARAMRNNSFITGFFGEKDGFDSFRQGADLIWFDQNRIGAFFFNAAIKRSFIGFNAENYFSDLGASLKLYESAGKNGDTVYFHPLLCDGGIHPPAGCGAQVLQRPLLRLLGGGIPALQGICPSGKKKQQ